MHTCIIGLAICGGVFSLGFAGDIVPVQARMENKVKIVDDTGNTIEERQSTDDYIRNSKGSLYQKKREIDPTSGQVVHISISVYNIAEGVEYHIDPKRKQVVFGTRKPRQPVFSRFPPELERTTYLGRRVVISPIKSGNFGKIGETWLDEESHLILYLEQKTNIQGLTRVKTMKTTEFITGVEPDPALFKIPEDYTIVESFR